MVALIEYPTMVSIQAIKVLPTRHFCNRVKCKDNKHIMYQRRDRTLPQNEISLKPEPNIDQHTNCRNDHRNHRIVLHLELMVELIVSAVISSSFTPNCSASALFNCSLSERLSSLVLKDHLVPSLLPFVPALRRPLLYW